MVRDTEGSEGSEGKESTLIFKNQNVTSMKTFFLGILPEPYIPVAASNSHEKGQNQSATATT